MVVVDFSVTIIVVVCCVIGLLTAGWFASRIALIKVERTGSARYASPKTQLLGAKHTVNDDELMDVYTISQSIAEGANAFLYMEYMYMGVFMAFFGLALLILLGTTNDWSSAGLTTVAFFAGVLTSVLSGFIGMRTAVFTNSRTALSAQKGYEWAFDTAFKGGAVMGFALVSLGLIVLYCLVNAFNAYFSDALEQGLWTPEQTAKGDNINFEQTKKMYECIAGYGLGGSSVAFSVVSVVVFTPRPLMLVPIWLVRSRLVSVKMTHVTPL